VEGIRGIGSKYLRVSGTTKLEE